MKNKKIMDSTDNSAIYRKARKAYLEVSKGLIRCSYCKCHRGENRKEWYGGFIEKGESLKEAKIKYPSWKLSSRNPKQWMSKNNVKMAIEPVRYVWSQYKNMLYVEFYIGSKSSKGIKYSSK